MALTIWTNASFNEAATQRLIEGVRPHRLIVATHRANSVLMAGKPDPSLVEATVAFGQPDPQQCRELPGLRWIEVTSAGYTRYDYEDFQEALRARGAAFTNMSAVFADPCAQHALAMMLALGRQLLPSYRDQSEGPRWEYFQRRRDSALLTGQTVLLLGYGAIARRLVELLGPFGMKVYALRRRAYSVPGVHTISEERLSAVMAEADHIVNVLPENEATLNYVNARRLSAVKPGAKFYNLGRGVTVDQRALQEALESGRLGAAYLDVTVPEPLPPEHPLWRAPHCYITPHTAGGRHDQDEAVVSHFLANLAAFECGAPLTDRVV